MTAEMDAEALAELQRLAGEYEQAEVGSEPDVNVTSLLDALPALLDAAEERDDLLAIIDDARHALSADGPKVEPARQVLARALPQTTAWQDRTRHARDNTPPHVIAHRGAQLDAVTAERDALAEKVERVRALHRPEGRHNFCGTCAYAPWPCATYRALDGERYLDDALDADA